MLAPQQADIVSARALAPLSELIDLVHRHLAKNGTALLMKGRQYRAEREHAQNHWRFACETASSCTDPTGVILKIGDIDRV